MWILLIHIAAVWVPTWVECDVQHLESLATWRVTCRVTYHSFCSSFSLCPWWYWTPSCTGLCMHLIVVMSVGVACLKMSMHTVCGASRVTWYTYYAFWSWLKSRNKYWFNVSFNQFPLSLCCVSKPHRLSLLQNWFPIWIVFCVLNWDCLTSFNILLEKQNSV